VFADVGATLGCVRELQSIQQQLLPLEVAVQAECDAAYPRKCGSKLAPSQSAALRSLPVCYREGDRALILASDGVWDRLPEADCVAVVESTLGTPSDQARGTNDHVVTVVP
jgi:Protein phosphatase 2C